MPVSLRELTGRLVAAVGVFGALANPGVLQAAQGGDAVPGQSLTVRLITVGPGDAVKVTLSKGSLTCEVRDRTYGPDDSGF